MNHASVEIGRNTMSAHVPRPWSQSLWVGALFLLVLLSRIIYVSLYAEDIPFWDQWDAEAQTLLKPWFEGTYSWAELFTPHQEHRIVLTRLWVLAITLLNNGQWDNLVEAYANILAFSIDIALVYWIAARNSTSTLIKATVFIVLLLTTWLPFDWENFLVGFQIQFYFLVGLSIATIAIASHFEEGSGTLLLCAIFALLAYGSMASSVFILPATFVVFFARWMIQRWNFQLLVSSALVLGFISLGLLHLIPPGKNVGYVAQDFRAFRHAFIMTMAWPTNWGIIGAILIWSPLAVWSINFVRIRNASKGDLFMLGLAAWCVFQAIAISYARGQVIDITKITSRYSELLILGIVANAWFACRLWESAPRNDQKRKLHQPTVALCVVYTITAMAGIVHATPFYWNGMKERHSLSNIQTYNVREFVRSGNFAALDQPHLHIPYPVATSLQDRLTDKTYRSMLPLSIRPALVADSNGAFHSAYPYVGITQEGKAAAFMLSDGARHTSIIELAQGTLYPTQVKLPGTTFQVRAASSTGIAPPSLTIVEQGRLSAFAHWLQARVRHLGYARERRTPTPGIYTSIADG
jgi:hypothetical protein